MSQSQYNSLMSGLLNQKYALAKLRAKLEGKRERIYQYCKKFGHLFHNYRNKKKKVKGKPISQNKFEVIVSSVMSHCNNVFIEQQTRKSNLLVSWQIIKYY